MAEQSIDLKARRKVRTFQPYVRPEHTVLDFGSAGGALIGGLRAARRIGVGINDAAQLWVPGDVNRHLFTWTPLNLGNLLDEAGYVVRRQRIIRRTVMRGHDLSAKLPRPLFTFVRYACSVVRHRQQLLMVATVKDA